MSDISRIRALGWEPQIPVEGNIRQYLDWLDTQTGTEEYLFEAERITAAQGVAHHIAR